MLPRLAGFYCDHLLKRLLQLLSSIAGTANKPGAGFRSPNAGYAPFTLGFGPSGSAQAGGCAGQQSPIQVAHTLSIHVGKWVTDAEKRGRFGRVIDIHDGQAKVLWEDGQRIRPIKIDDIRVMPLAPHEKVIAPTTPGQQVLVVSGAYSGQQGVTMAITGPKWRVNIHDDIISLEADVLHAPKQPQPEMAAQVTVLSDPPPLLVRVFTVVRLRVRTR